MFREWAAKVWADDEREAFIDFISTNPEAGDVIKSSGGLRKVRWSREGKGKRGGVRVIYFTRLPRGEVALLIVYAKSKFDNLPADFLLKLKEKLYGKED
ncbi:MAG: hypothetical protein QM612_02685 [Thermomonas sp.]|uniref:hypothetical protein n=1 Tax=Thermomonas sp. TaxID=1971895 RepID=UPI0039E63197